MSAVVRPRFYLLISFALAALVLVGFAPTFYLRFLFDRPPLPTLLLHVHGAVFTIWLGLFITQVSLVAAHRVDLHRKLGIASAIFAIVVVVVGVLTSLQTAISDHVSPSGLTPARFSIIPLASISLFAIFIGVGVAFRQRPALHKRFMILGMIASVGPAAARVVRMFALNDYRNVLIPAIYAAFIAWCLVNDWRKHRIVHPVYAIGGLVIVASWPLRIMIGHSDWWRPVSEGVARVARSIF
jgi:hypothetical protein